jgi:hypothetical protein
MSRERSIFGIVVLTTCITSTVLVAGWFAAGRYLNQPATTVAQEPAPTAPAPRPKGKRPARPEGARGTAPETTSSKDPAPGGGQIAAKGDAPGAPDDTAASAGRGAAPPAESEPAGDRTETLPSKPAVEPIAAPIAVADNKADARTIMEEAQRRAEARFYRYDGLLQSFDPSEKATEKRWTFDRVGSHGQSKTVLRFTAPAEVKGVALLILNHPERASDQWMWTPSIERDRRIALQDRSTRFFGTDFSFEDLEERDVEQFDYSMLGNDTLDGVGCWKIQQTPKRTRSSQYTRSIAWIRKDNYSMARLDNFVKDEVVKRLSFSTIENIQGIWTARLMEMYDLRRNTHTRLNLQQVKYNAPMKEDDFTLLAIRR